MNYVKVENGVVTHVGLPTAGMINVKTVSGYNLLPESILETEGWLPLNEVIPMYDTETQVLQLVNYTIVDNVVTANYIAVDKPAEPVTDSERIDLLQDAIDFILTSY